MKYTSCCSEIGPVTVAMVARVSNIVVPFTGVVKVLLLYGCQVQYAKLVPAEGNRPQFNGLKMA